MLRRCGYGELARLGEDGPARRDVAKMLIVYVIGLRVQLLSSCGEPLFEGRAERSRAAAPGGE